MRGPFLRSATQEAALVLRPCLAGLTTGGSYGLVEGLRTSQGERRRIRINSVLNSMGRRGPGWGNSLGCVGAFQEPLPLSQLSV